MNNERLTSHPYDTGPEQGTRFEHGTQIDLQKANPDNASAAEGRARAEIDQLTREAFEATGERSRTLWQTIGMRGLWLRQVRAHTAQTGQTPPSAVAPTQKDFDLAGGE